MFTFCSIKGGFYNFLIYLFSVLRREEGDGIFKRKKSSKRRSALSTLSKRKPDPDPTGDDSEDFDLDLKRIKAEPEVMIGTGLDESAEDFVGGPTGKDEDFENFGQFGDDGQDFDESIEEIARPSGADGDSKGKLEKI